MNAKQRIDLQKEHTYYRKVGRKYVPAPDIETSCLMEGWILIHKQPGSVSYMSIVDPNRAEIEAAIREKSDQLVRILDKHHRARPTRQLTPEQRADWEALNEKHPEMFRMVQYESLYRMAQDILNELLPSEQ